MTCPHVRQPEVVHTRACSLHGFTRLLLRGLCKRVGRVGRKAALLILRGVFGVLLGRSGTLLVRLGRGLRLLVAHLALWVRRLATGLGCRHGG